MNRTAITCTIIAALGLLGFGAMLTAGPLNPPGGAVTSTYKTLAEVEPRIAINATNTPGGSDSLFRIAQSGSYYLTGDITGVAGKHGIKIESSNVTLDLNGYGITGVGAGGGDFDGVSLAIGLGYGVTVRNGTVQFWGGRGVDLDVFGTTGCRVEGVRVRNNTDSGIVVGVGGAVVGCNAERNGRDGIVADDDGLVEGCSSNDNGGIGINANASLVTACVASHNAEHGIYTTRSIIERCVCRFNGFDGIRGETACTITQNTCSTNGTLGLFAGIYANGTDCRIEANHVFANDAGISASGDGHLVIRNYASANLSGNYILPPSGSFVGTIVGTSAAMNAAENGNTNISN